MNLRSKSPILKGVFLGVLFTCVLAPVCGYVYLRYGPVPVAAADTPFPYEEQIVHIPLDTRINRQLASPPFRATAQNLTGGAHVFVDHCAMCHGTPNYTCDFAKSMYPTVLQRWTKGENGAVGVSDDAPGVSFWKVNNGIRLTGMPAFNHILSQTEMWQVSLLHGANQPLPSSVTDVLDQASVTSIKSSSAQTPGGPSRNTEPGGHK